MPLFRKRQPKTITALDCGSSTQLEVKGEASYQANLERVAGPKRPEGYDWSGSDVMAILKRDPGNAYDPNAVQVLVKGLLVGFVNREDAAWVSKAVERVEREEGRPVAVNGQYVGGWKGGPGEEDGH